MTYLALLRGINVGGNNKVSMDDLKKVFLSLGFSDVSTYINSGNVIFKTNKIPAVSIIEKALHKAFGFEIKILIRDAKNIQKLCKVLPRAWANDTQQRTDILFLWDEFDSKKSIALIETSPVDHLIYIPGAIAWNIVRADYRKSKMNKFIGAVVYKHMTARNINTVKKLSELMKK